MPEIKEKPKAGKPKGRRKSAGPPRQAGRLMKEKLVREVDQRKEREAENGSYAVDQVEQAGVQGADEFIQASGQTTEEIRCREYAERKGK